MQEREAMRILPTDWRAICERTLGSVGTQDVGVESLAALEGRTRALRELARVALRRRAYLDNADELLRRARAIAPDAAEVLYASARLWTLWEQPASPWHCGAERRDEEALRALQTLRREHPEFMADAVTFDLAVALTRLHRFAEAAAAYETAMTLSLDGQETSTVLANRAEVTMLSGDLEAAVGLYERARSKARGSREHLLATWGLAVAIDRLGEHEEAIAMLAKALIADGGGMRVLRDGGVFFEPERERDYYEGLGHEALAEQSKDDRARALQLAAASFRRFLADGADDAFAQAARANLQRLESRPRNAERGPTATQRR